MFKVRFLRGNQDEMLRYLERARELSSDDSIAWDDIEGAVRDGRFTVEQCLGLTRAFKELAGVTRFRAIWSLVEQRMYVEERGRIPVRLSYFPAEENWQNVWESFAVTSLEFGTLHELVDEDNGRTRLFHPDTVSIITRILGGAGKKELPVAMHAAGALLLRLFADREGLGAFEMTEPNPTSIHPEEVARALSGKGVKESLFLLFKVIGKEVVDPILRTYAIQLMLFVAKHRVDSLTDEQRRFFVERIVRPALKDERIFNVYTSYLAMRLADPEAAAALGPADHGRYAPLDRLGDKYRQYIAATGNTFRITLFQGALDGLRDIDDPTFQVAPFSLIRPLHILADYRPDWRSHRTRMKLERLTELAAEPGFAQMDLWEKFFTYTPSRRKAIELMEIGDGLLYVRDGHGRLGAAIMAAARGVIPAGWLEQVPALVYSTRDLPTSLMHEIMTMGVELTWPELFPGDEAVARLFSKGGGGAEGGAGGGAGGGVEGGFAPGGGVGCASAESRAASLASQIVSTTAAGIGPWVGASTLLGLGWSAPII